MKMKNSTFLVALISLFRETFLNSSAVYSRSGKIHDIKLTVIAQISANVACQRKIDILYKAHDPLNMF